MHRAALCFLNKTLGKREMEIAASRVGKRVSRARDGNSKEVIIAPSSAHRVGKVASGIEIQWS
ncbi:hypothetical protein EWB00_000213 [Schistosoma japonicum]|uniref:Uncharacterized protein n=1 Tax=Schistosoma japonicum TaxID=6182 RepID=A0A4Z2CKG0_SCHJA|nr:hypothetical protein EWB00_000213 [Schistosoma japonicum]